MSRQVAAGRGGRGGRGARGGRFNARGFAGAPKAYKSTIEEIQDETYNTGHAKYAAQCKETTKNLATYITRTGGDESFLAAKTVRTGEEQTIELPAAVDPLDADAVLMRNEELRGIAKRRQKLDAAVKKAFALMWGQCSQDVKLKLEESEGWEAIFEQQQLHLLMQKINRICVGFDEHKQGTMALVEGLKALFLYRQGKDQPTEQFTKNLLSLYTTVEQFGGSPGDQEGLVQDKLQSMHGENPPRVVDVDNPTDAEKALAKAEVTEEIKAALIMSGADKIRFDSLRRELNNDFMAGHDNWPKTAEEAKLRLQHYQPLVSPTYRADTPRHDGVAFMQGGGGGKGGGGKGGGGKAEAENEDGVQYNKAGESACFHCGKEGHWQSNCPDKKAEMEAELHMQQAALDSVDEGDEEEYSMLNVTLLQEEEGLPKDRYYLDNCSTVTSLVNDAHISDLKTVSRGLDVNCNAGRTTTKRVGKLGALQAWHLPKGIANIISQNELEKFVRITYDSLEGYYVAHTKGGPVRFYKDEKGLPYLDIKESDEAAALLFVQTVREGFEGFTKKEVLKAKEARRAQGMLGGPSKADFAGME